MSVMFHGSFGLNRKYMAGILNSGLNKPVLKDKDLAKMFGYGASFSARYRSWLHKCGMIEQGLPFVLTELGSVVSHNDPNLEMEVSQCFLHHELVSDPHRAEAWHYFASEFLQRNSEFTKEQLLQGLTQKLRYHSEMHFGPGSKLNKIILRKILEVYTGEPGLGSLGLVELKGGTYYSIKPKISGPWKTVSALRKAYK